MYLSFFYAFLWLYKSFLFIINNTHCLDVLWLIYLFSYWKTSSLLPYLAWLKLLPISICRYLCRYKYSTLLGKVWLRDCMISCKQPSNFLPKWLYHFALPWPMVESSSYSTSLLAFCDVTILNFFHFNRYIVVFHCSFNYPDDMRCGASCFMLICHLYTFFSEVTVNVFVSFFDRDVDFF